MKYRRNIVAILFRYKYKPKAKLKTLIKKGRKRGKGEREGGKICWYTV